MNKEKLAGLLEKDKAPLKVKISLQKSKILTSVAQG